MHNTDSGHGKSQAHQSPSLSPSDDDNTPAGQPPRSAADDMDAPISSEEDSPSSDTDSDNPDPAKTLERQQIQARNDSRNHRRYLRTKARMAKEKAARDADRAQFMVEKFGKGPDGKTTQQALYEELQEKKAKAEKWQAAAKEKRRQRQRQRQTGKSIFYRI